MHQVIINYFIKNANLVADGYYVPKWQYDNVRETVIDHGIDMHVKDLQNKLATIKRIATDE